MLSVSPASWGRCTHTPTSFGCSGSMKGPYNSWTWPRDVAMLWAGFSLCCRADTRKSLLFEAKTDVLGYQSWHRRLCTDQQTLLVLKPQLSSVAHACAMTYLYLHLLASCSLMQCWPSACYSLDRVQQPWMLPPSLPSEQEEKSLCSGSNCGGHLWMPIPHCRFFLMRNWEEEFSLFSLLPRESSP